MGYDHLDWDLASDSSANQVVKATEYCSVKDDFLLSNPKGKTFYANFPFSRMKEMTAHFTTVWEDGNFETGFILANANTSSAWFNKLGSLASHIMFTKRISFYNPDSNKTETNNPKGQVIFYFSKDDLSFYNYQKNFNNFVTLHATKS
jgi:hypothetical protein